MNLIIERTNEKLELTERPLTHVTLHDNNIDNNEANNNKHNQYFTIYSTRDLDSFLLRFMMVLSIVAAAIFNSLIPGEMVIRI